MFPSRLTRCLRVAVMAAVTLIAGTGLVAVNQSAASARPGTCALYSPTTWFWAANTHFSGAEDPAWCLQTGNYNLVLQADHNWVLYQTTRDGDKPIWASWTQNLDRSFCLSNPFAGCGGQKVTDVVFQSDGNVVFYGDFAHVYWASSRWGTWFNHKPCAPTRYYARIQPPTAGRGVHVDFGEVCSNGAWYNFYAIDPGRVAAPAVYAYR